ncbi:hypothetical protein CSUI_010195, partial [Cystoisospora suis]
MSEIFQGMERHASAVSERQQDRYLEIVGGKLQRKEAEFSLFLSTPRAELSYFEKILDQIHKDFTGRYYTHPHFNSKGSSPKGMAGPKSEGRSLSKGEEVRGEEKDSLLPFHPKKRRVEHQEEKQKEGDDLVDTAAYPRGGGGEEEEKREEEEREDGDGQDISVVDLSSWQSGIRPSQSHSTSSSLLSVDQIASRLLSSLKSLNPSWD